MASLREYYEKDFSHSTRVSIKIPFDDSWVEGAILYDFAGFYSFLALYVGHGKSVDYLERLVASLSYGKTQVHLDGKVTLPSAKEFPGSLKIDNKVDFEILAQYFGDSEWISTKGIQASRRLFIYTETILTEEQISLLKKFAKNHGHELQLRAEQFRSQRATIEKPVAFISHDSRDKEEVAKKIALGLQRRLCPVWYDEFNLKLGDNLRESIEKGLKECKKCILVLSPNFLSNAGWTKTEFESIFTREILEGQKLVLPIWYKVSKKELYDYSPSLLNVVGKDWEALGEEEICRQIYQVIME
jgi:hypothetical protein